MKCKQCGSELIIFTETFRPEPNYIKKESPLAFQFLLAKDTILVVVIGLFSTLIFITGTASSWTYNYLTDSYGITGEGLLLIIIFSIYSLLLLYHLQKRENQARIITISTLLIIFILFYSEKNILLLVNLVYDILVLTFHSKTKDLFKITENILSASND